MEMAADCALDGQSRGYAPLGCPDLTHRAGPLAAVDGTVLAGITKFLAVQPRFSVAVPVPPCKLADQ